MVSPEQYRTEATEFCKTALSPLCKEMTDWIDGGTLGDAPFFRVLVEKCKLFAGVEYGRKVAENMVRTEAMRAVPRMVYA